MVYRYGAKRIAEPVEETPLCVSPVTVGDDVKQSKEGRYMPGVKRLYQESENSAKGEYILGHMFGGLDC